MLLPWSLLSMCRLKGIAVVLNDYKEIFLKVCSTLDNRVLNKKVARLGWPLGNVLMEESLSRWRPLRWRQPRCEGLWVLVCFVGACKLCVASVYPGAWLCSQWFLAVRVSRVSFWTDGNSKELRSGCSVLRVHSFSQGKRRNMAIELPTPKSKCLRT